MNQMNLQTITGWFAFIHMIAGVTSFIALMLFFVKGGLWGPINDVLSVIWALSLIPLVMWFFQANREINWPLAAAAAVLGIGAMLLFAVLQLLLVVGVVRYEQTVGTILTLTGVIGLVLLLNGLMARTWGILPPGLILVMVGGGVGLLICAVGYFLGGERHPLAAIGYVAGFIAGFVWPVWLARILLAGPGIFFQ